MQREDVDPTVRTSDPQVFAVVGIDRAAWSFRTTGFEVRFENLGRIRLLFLSQQPGPGCRIGRQPAYEIHDPASVPRPVDEAVLLEYLGRRVQCRFVDVLLFDGADVACGDPVDGFGHQRRAPVHQFVVERTHVVFGQDRHANLSDDGAFVDLVVQE